ncbi:hypothetical protein F5Y10DRAFT_249259 [Nemania abortiva]|nr:hypothetical protein F5Y10DRAFT_249259 [Nemania abortiva]
MPTRRSQRGVSAYRTMGRLDRDRLPVCNALVPTCTIGTVHMYISPSTLATHHIWICIHTLGTYTYFMYVCIHALD